MGKKGVKLSDEHKRKMSEKLKGHIPWNKGITHSEETKRKLSEIGKGRVVTDETKKKISEGNKGKINSEETRRKISEGNKGKIVSEESRRKMSESRKGRVFTEEHRKHLSESGKGRKLSEESKKKKGESYKRFIKDHPEKHPNYIMAQKGFISSIERKVKDILDELNISYEPNYPIFNYFVDFAILDKKLIIECDGDYWHNLPGAKERDKERQTQLESFGWSFIRFSESEINKDIDFVRSKLTNSL
jgi:very-short-patch-repair endonuclease